MRYVDTPFFVFLDSDDWFNNRFVECFSKNDRKIQTNTRISIFTLPWVFDTVTRRVMEWKDKDLYDQIFDSKSGDSRVITNTRNNPELYAHWK